MPKRGLARLLALLLAFAMIAAACGGSSDSSEVSEEEASTEETTESTVKDEDTKVETTVAEPDVDKFGGDLIMGLEAEATGLRPWEDTCSAPCYNMLAAVYDKLVEQDVNGDYVGFLAESFAPNDDFSVWTVQLREGVTFHNGVALTAQSVADMFPLQQVGASASGQIAAAGITAVDATGDLEVTYTLSSPSSAFPAFLSRAPIGMVFEAAAAIADPDGSANAPIGTGPFVIESRDVDNETVFVRNDSYWLSDAEGDSLPYLDSVTFRPTPDEGTRLDALTSGTTNAMHTLRQGTIRDANNNSEGLTLLKFQGNSIGGGQYNTALAPYDDVRVRRGLTHLNSQEKSIEALGGTGLSDPGTQWFSKDSPWYSETVAAAYPEFDFEAGVALLQEYIDDPERSDGKAAGENIDVELSCPPDPTLQAAMQVLEQTWTGSGLINVTMTSFDQATHIGMAIGAAPDYTGTHGAHCWRIGSQDDPSVPIGQALNPPNEEVALANGLESSFSPLNVTNYFSLAGYEAALAATETDDFATRYALYESIMLDLAEQVPMWYSGHTATMIATADNVNGFNGWLLPNGEIGIGFPAAEGRFHEVWISE